MTEYEVDPAGVLRNGSRVRLSDVEGNYFTHSTGQYAGVLYPDSREKNAIFIARGLEHNLVVLREAVNNVPSRPGLYEVTWNDGRKSWLNPFTIHNDGRVTCGRSNNGYPVNDDLKTAVWVRLPAPEPVLWGVRWTNNKRTWENWGDNENDYRVLASNSSQYTLLKRVGISGQVEVVNG